MVIPLDTLNVNDGLPTMSSREIAKLAGIAHNEVKRMIKSLETAQRLSQPLKTQLYEREGEMRQAFLLNKRDSVMTVARLSPGFTADILDYWQERERAISLPDFTNPAAAAHAWAEQYEKRQRAEEQLALMFPKAAFFDGYVNVEKALSFRELCKMLKAKEPDFRQFLLERNIMLRVSGVLMPAQHHIQAGYFTVRDGVAENQRSWSQARFTARGVKWIADLWAGHLAQLPIELPLLDRTEPAPQGRNWL